MLDLKILDDKTNTVPYTVSLMHYYNSGFLNFQILKLMEGNDKAFVALQLKALQSK